MVFELGVSFSIGLYPDLVSFWIQCWVNFGAGLGSVCCSLVGGRVPSYKMRLKV